MFQYRRLHWSLAGEWEILFDPNDDITITELLSRNGDPITAVPSVYNVSERGAGYLGSVWYRRPVSVPIGCDMCELHVEGWYGKAEFYWNECKLGERAYGWTPFSIFFALAQDSNDDDNGVRTGMISVRIDNRDQPGQTYQEADFMAWGGIHREIKLIALTDTFLERADFWSDVKNFTTGEADLHCKAVILSTKSSLALEQTGIQDIRAFLRHEGRIIPLERVTPIRQVETSKHVVLVNSGDAIPLHEYHVELTAHAECELWSLESPSLYSLGVQLISGMAVIDEIGYRVGIRKIDTSPHGQLLLNGRPVMFLGTTRHDDHPESGPAFNPHLIEHDLQVMKAHGFTGVRPGHYPTTEHFLNVADQLGIMIMEEVPNYIMTPGMMRDPLVLERGLRMLREMIIAHRNHPCIMIWSIANECKSHLPESKAMLRGLADLAHDIDPNRSVHFTGYPGIQNIVDCHADIAGINVYYGDSVSGRSTEPDVLGSVLDNLRMFMEDPEIGMETVPLFITEFGSQTVYGYHEIAPYQGKDGASSKTPFTIFTEERQAYVIERFIEQVKTRPFVAGVLVWCWRDNRYEPGIAQSSAGTIMRYGLLDWNGAPKLGFAILSRLFREKWKQ